MRRLVTHRIDPPRSSQELAQRRVLLVEDDPDDSEVISELLSDCAAVCCAGTVAQASQLARSGEFDVALVDASLPDAKGASAIEALATLGMFPVVLLTGTDSAELGKSAARAGAQDYLVKGQFTPAQLRRAISSAIFRHEALSQYRKLLQDSPDGVLVFDHAGTILFANPAAVEAFGVTNEGELVGERIRCPVEEAARGTVELHLGGGRTVELHVGRVPWRGEEAYLAIVRDVTERARLLAELTEANQALSRMAVRDPLTGALNRRGVEEALHRMSDAQRRGAGRSAALLFDCDDFKSINALAGYAAGDATLQLVARTLTDGVRPSFDCVGRIGGDEFLVLLPNTRLAEGLLVAERLREAIRSKPHPVATPGRESGVTVSVGVASVPYGAASLKEVLELAESALVASKTGGKNRVTAGGPEAAETPRQDLDLRALLARPSTISVAAQPIVRHPGGEPIGHELLFRGPPDSPLETPAAFFAAARRDQLLGEADLTCLRRCLEVGSSHPHLGRVHLNAYPSTLLDTPSETLLQTFKGSGQFVIELSEQEFVGAPALLQPVIERLRQAGVRLALDDIGFGHSSLETVLVLEPEIIKIDRCLVHGISQNLGQRKVLDRLLHCLAGLNAEIIAEGIEHEADARVVQDLGVPFVQGFLWGAPRRVGGPTGVAAREAGDGSSSVAPQ